MPKQKTKTIEGQVLRVTKRKAISGAWAHGLVIRSQEYTLFTDEEFFPVRAGDHVFFAVKTKRLKSGRGKTYFAIQPDSLRIQDANPDVELSAGYVYVLVNEAMPGMVKIGFTERTPTERAKELSYSTGIPKPFEVAWSIRIQGDAELIERACHEELKAKGRGKEFFAISVAAAEKLVRQKYSEIYPKMLSGRKQLLSDDWRSLRSVVRPHLRKCVQKVSVKSTKLLLSTNGSKVVVLM